MDKTASSSKLLKKYDFAVSPSPDNSRYLFYILNSFYLITQFAVNITTTMGKIQYVYHAKDSIPADKFVMKVTQGLCEFERNGNVIFDQFTSSFARGIIAIEIQDARDASKHMGILIVICQDSEKEKAYFFSSVESKILALVNIIVNELITPSVDESSAKKLVDEGGEFYSF